MFEAAIDLNAITTPTAADILSQPPAIIRPWVDHPRLAPARLDYAAHVATTSVKEWVPTSEHLKPTAHDRALTKVRSFLELKPDWDGEGASVVDRRAVAVAEAVLSIAASANVRLNPSVGGTGTIFLHPRDCDLEGEITVGSEGDLLALLEDADGPHDIETDPGEAVPNALREVLRRAGRTAQVGTPLLAA